MKRLVLIAMVVLLSSTIPIAQDLCEGADWPAPVKKTGWTSCFDLYGNPRDCEGTGEDGEHQKGVQIPNPRFTDNGDGTVTDNLTGLIWLKLANRFGPRSWNDALSDSNGLESGGCGFMDGSSAGDWRLPNRFELESLVDLLNASPPLPSGHPFTNVQTDLYWSSTADSYFQKPWCMSMVTGHVTTGCPLSYVWPVRGPDSDSDGFDDHIDNCPSNCNTQQLDADDDGIGDVCDDPGDDGCFSCGNGPICETEC